MLRDLLSSRWFQGCLIFFLLCVAGSLLYSWHVQRTTESDMERHDQFLQRTEQQKATRPAEAVNVPTENEAPGRVSTPVGNTDTLMSGESEALPNETETLDFADAFLPDDMVSEEEVPNEEVSTSPFGFGAYPEIPPGFPIKRRIVSSGKQHHLCFLMRPVSTARFHQLARFLLKYEA